MTDATTASKKETNGGFFGFVGDAFSSTVDAIINGNDQPTSSEPESQNGKDFFGRLGDIALTTVESIGRELPGFTRSLIVSNREPIPQQPTFIDRPAGPFPSFEQSPQSAASSQQGLDLGGIVILAAIGFIGFKLLN